MAGGEDTILIQDLHRFRTEWLVSAEVSVQLDDPRRTGLSFFFLEEAAFSEFAAEESMSEALLTAEKSMRAKYRLLPRYWVKLHYTEGGRSGLSQYFQIDPREHYPITTIRRFLRENGFPQVGTLEETLRPALESRTAQWGLALKRFPDRIVPRIFCGLERRLLEEMLKRFVFSGYLSEGVSRHYLKWDSMIEAGGRIFISFDPPLKSFSSVDFVDLPSKQFPGSLAVSLPERLPYLKVRISDPSLPPRFTAYMPFSACRPQRERSVTASEKPF